MYFLSVEEVLYIHQAETTYAQHDSNIRDLNLLKSAIENTRLIYENGYSKDIFDLAASYIKSIALNHPFIDGNKRTALTTTMVFLDFNGYSITENHDEELADLILAFINKEISQKDLANTLKQRSILSL